MRSLVRDSVTRASKRIVDRAEEERRLRLALVGEIVGEFLDPNRKTNHLLYQRLEAMKRHKVSVRPEAPVRPSSASEDEPLYIGDTQDSLPHGEGTMWYRSNDVYSGHWSSGMRHGVGSFWSAKGAYYHGEFKDDRIEGIGEYHWADGHIYHGGFASNKKHGVGAMWYINCDFYEGEWCMGKRNGRGLALYSRGHWVQGEFMAGAYYDGEWRDDKRHGCGTYRFSNGDVYKGEFMNGNIYGQGRFTDGHSGMCFKGEMENVGLGGDASEPLRALSKGVYWYAHGTCRHCGNKGICRGHAYMYI